MEPNWITVVAVLVIGSFAIDRIVSGLLFLFFRDPPSPPGATPEENMKKYELERKYKLWYFALSSVLVIIVLFCSSIRVLAGLGYHDPNSILDALLTGIVLVGGADRLAGLKLGEASPAGEPEGKFKVTGEINLTK